MKSDVTDWNCSDHHASQMHLDDTFSLRDAATVMPTNSDVGRVLRDVPPVRCNLIASGELHMGLATSDDRRIYRNLYIEAS